MVDIMVRSVKQKASQRKASLASAAARKAKAAIKPSRSDAEAAYRKKFKVPADATIDHSIDGHRGPFKPRKAAKPPTQRQIADSVKKRTGFTPAQLAKGRKMYDLGGRISIADLRRAKQMAPPKGISAELHKAILDQAIVQQQNNRDYERSMRERGAW